MYLIKISFIIIFICLLFILPRKYIVYIQQLFEKTYVKLRKLFVATELQNADKLLISCSTMPQFLKSDLSVHHYKFYNRLLLRVKQFNKTLGTPINKYLVELRKAILMDMKFERKIHSEKSKTMVQAFFLVIIMVSFILLYKKQMELNISNLSIVILVAFQLFGVWIVDVIYNFIKSKYFTEFTIIYEVLYTLKIRLEVGGPIQHILEDCGVNKAYYLKKKTIVPISLRLEKLVSAWRQSGQGISTEIMELITEVNFRFEECLDHFLQAVIFLRFISLVLFFLLPFLGINLFFFAILFQ